jgi:hypothetical protein
MPTRTRLPLQASVLILAGLLDCSSPSDQNEPSRTAWERAVGLVDNGGIALDPLIVPDTVRAGIPFTATVSTFGSTNCIRPDRSRVQGSGLQADITPFDSVWSGSPPCLPGWQGYPRSIELTFATPGKALVRLHGRGFTGDLVFDKPVTVRR